MTQSCLQFTGVYAKLWQVAASSDCLQQETQLRYVDCVQGEFCSTMLCVLTQTSARKHSSQGQTSASSTCRAVTSSAEAVGPCC